IVNLLDVRRQLAPEFAHAGRSSGGDEDLEVGHARLQRADELGADVDLADAHRVHPQDVTVGERLPEPGVVAAEPLAKTAAPVAAPPHFQKVIRRRDAEENREQNVVKGTHGPIANLKLSVTKPRWSAKKNSTEKNPPDDQQHRHHAEQRVFENET